MTPDTSGLGVRRSWPHDLRLLWFVIGTVAVTVLAPVIVTGPNLLTFDLAVIYAIAAIGLNVIFGLGGLLSVAQAAVMAVGAYAVVLTLNRFHIAVLLALAIACVLGAVTSGLTGLIAIRIRSHYFILASVALAEGVVLVITNETKLTGGSNGVGFDGLPTVFGLDPSDPAQFVLIGVPLAGLVWYLAACLRESRLGVALHAVRSDDYLALASAIPASRCRLWATVIGGAFGGLAGGLLALLDGYIGPQSFGLTTAVLLLLMVVFGGASSNGGTVVAAIVLTALTQGLLTATKVGDLVYGVAIVLLLVFASGGLAGLARGAFEWGRRRGHRSKTGQST
ncbi:amino acid/amide ABC transporter membrane protein 2 (HAAT family) [Antricoccus suffuscus]|uniref:Amino acid/amide ABC transporter membrane protein 2 (HAAT family) n=1 Tax=Antricoccus suffuscus TaxID=1629062 RepID=A0A2T1A6T9_9ACTN|nr:branched-chain amino acid ABC transporter permease [Antricoccus suffuscus]PRZ44323.1 amino acid/amide ABC transporter membrane protein 2 (HAAT family) [Antricoccus suffuscus]